MGAPLKPVFNTPGKRGRKPADDLRTVVDAMLYIAQTGLPVALPARVGRLELVLVDRGAAARLGRRHGVEVRRVGWDDTQPDFRPHPRRMAGGSGARAPRPMPPTRQVV